MDRCDERDIKTVEGEEATGVLVDTFLKILHNRYRS